MGKFSSRFGKRTSEQDISTTCSRSSSTIYTSTEDHHQQHPKRSISSRRSSYESATQGNGVVLAKNERWGDDPIHPHHHLSRHASVNATFDEGVVMEAGFRGYLVVFGGFLIILAAIGYVSIYGIFQSKYNEIYGAQGKTQSSISFVGSLACGFQFGFTIVAGPVMNRFGHKLWQLYLTQGVMFGIGASLLNLAATAIPPLWYDKHRGLAMGICFCGAGVGGLVLGFAIPALINALDVFWTMRIYAIFHFVCTAFAALVMRAPRQLSGPPVVAKKDMMNLAIMKDPGFML
ncbi:hypothetical protein BGZ75_003127, partial [Mortierella antarctica]